ncbi:hypothetical protein JCM10295v2_007172 [Rhodotorula toruloides]
MAASQYLPTALWNGTVKQPILRRQSKTGSGPLNATKNTRKPITSDAESVGTVTRLRHLPAVFNNLNWRFEAEILPLLDWKESQAFSDADGDNDRAQGHDVYERDAGEFVSVYVLRRTQWYTQHVFGEDAQCGAQAIKLQQGAADLALSSFSQPTAEIFLEVKLEAKRRHRRHRWSRSALPLCMRPPPDWKTANIAKNKIERQLLELAKADLLQPPAEPLSSSRSAPSRSRKPSPTLVASLGSAALYQQSSAMDELLARLSALKVEKSSRAQPDPSQWEKWGWHGEGEEPAKWHELDEGEQHVLLIYQQISNQLGAVKRRGPPIPFRALVLCSPVKFVPTILIDSTLIRGNPIKDLATAARVVSILDILLDRSLRREKPPSIDAERALGGEILDWLMEMGRGGTGTEQASTPSSDTGMSTPQAQDTLFTETTNKSSSAVETNFASLASSVATLGSAFTASSHRSFSASMSSSDSLAASAHSLFSMVGTTSSTATDTSASSLPHLPSNETSEKSARRLSRDLSDLKLAIRNAQYAVIRSSVPDFAGIDHVYHRQFAPNEVDSDILVSAARLQLVEMLGCGGTRVDYKDETGDFAVKLVIPYADEDSEPSLHRIYEALNEVDFLKSQAEGLPSCSPSFYGMFSAFDLEDRPYLALIFDLVEGTVKPVSRPSTFSHKARISHGDLRPPYFIVQTNGTVKIIDYARAHGKASPVELDAERQQSLADIDLAPSETG